MSERTHLCSACQLPVDETEGTWDCEPAFVGDRGPEGFICYDCLCADDPDATPEGEYLSPCDSGTCFCGAELDAFGACVERPFPTCKTRLDILETSE